MSSSEREDLLTDIVSSSERGDLLTDIVSSSERGENQVPGTVSLQSQLTGFLV